MRAPVAAQPAPPAALVPVAAGLSIAPAPPSMDWSGWSGFEGRLLAEAQGKLPFVLGLTLLLLAAVALCWSRRLRGYSVLLAERAGVSELVMHAAAGGSTLKRVTFEFDLPRSMQAPGTPRLQPVSRVVDVEGVRSAPALRDLLVAIAADLPGGEEGLSAEALDIFLVSAGGRRTRFSGRAQLQALRHAHELVVNVSGDAPVSMAERRECAHREEKSLLLTLDDEEMAVVVGGPGGSSSSARGGGDLDPESPGGARCSRAGSSEKLI